VTTNKEVSQMKQLLTTTFTILSVIIILDSMNFGHALMMFLLAGVIPGTTIVLSGEQMLQLFTTIFGFICARLARRAFAYAVSRQTAQHSQPKAAILAK
jgi:hypothetical protein